MHGDIHKSPCHTQFHAALISRAIFSHWYVPRCFPIRSHLLDHNIYLFIKSCLHSAYTAFLPISLTYTYLNHSWRYLWFLLSLQKLHSKQWHLDIILQEKIFLPIYLIHFWFESIKGNRFDLCTIFWWTLRISFVSGRKRQILLFTLLCSLYLFFMSPNILNFNFRFGLKNVYLCYYFIFKCGFSTE